MSLRDVFSVQTMGDLAGQYVYERGVGYHAGGRVEPVEGSDQRVEAVVRGTLPYTVELWVDRGKPAWSCTCPFAEDGSFCKHCVAVGLLFAEGSIPLLTIVPEPDETVHGSNVSSHVAELSHDRLVEIVLEQCDTDWRLRERMVAEVRAARGDGPDDASWRRRIDNAFAPNGDLVPYQDAPEWAAEVYDVVDALSDLANAGHADAVIALAEHAHGCAEAATQYIDDSDGWLSDIEDRVVNLHLSACETARPDSVALARRLADLELTSELDGFHRAALTYADVLGPEGIAEYRRLVAPRWEALPDKTDRFSGRRFAVEQAMIGIALAGRDPDELIDIRGKNLGSPWDYLEIARALADAERVDEAIEWSRRGMAEYASRTHQLPDLRDFLAEILRSQGEDWEAVELYWEAFVSTPSLSGYRRLLHEGADDEIAWSRRCIDALGTEIDDLGLGDSDSAPYAASAISRVLVEILVYEGDIEGAWTVAVEHGCDDSMWVTLARAREADHPLDSIPVYEREVFTLIDQKKKHTYKAAVDLLDRIRLLADRIEQPELFTTILERVRTEHRAKRNLKKLLDAMGW